MKHAMQGISSQTPGLKSDILTASHHVSNKKHVVGEDITLHSGGTEVGKRQGGNSSGGLLYVNRNCTVNETGTEV